MDVREFQDLANKSGFGPMFFASNERRNGLPSAGTVIQPTASKDSWEVFDTEKGSKFEVRVFSNESDACAFALEKLGRWINQAKHRPSIISAQKMERANEVAARADLKRQEIYISRGLDPDTGLPAGSVEG